MVYGHPWMEAELPSTNSRKGRNLTSYELRKGGVDRGAAESLFSQGFATSAFEAALRPSRENSRTSELPQTIRSWIVQQGRTSLATACLTYMLAVEIPQDRLDDGSFVGLVRQIKDGATKIAEAANLLARQAMTHFEETGEDERVRLSALRQLAWALNGAFGSEDDGNFAGQMLPRRICNRFAGLEMTHGLSNCLRLANSAENFLADYNARAKARPGSRTSQAGDTKSGTLAMAKGRRPNKDRDVFLEDLAIIYERGVLRKAKANSGSFTSGGAPSPFTRFVRRVFQELQVITYQIIIDRDQAFDSRFETPSVDAIRDALKRREIIRRQRKENSNKID